MSLPMSSWSRNLCLPADKGNTCRCGGTLLNILHPSYRRPRLSTASEVLQPFGCFDAKERLRKLSLTNLLTCEVSAGFNSRFRYRKSVSCQRKQCFFFGTLLKTSQNARCFATPLRCPSMMYGQITSGFDQATTGRYGHICA